MLMVGSFNVVAGFVALFKDLQAIAPVQRLNIYFNSQGALL